MSPSHWQMSSRRICQIPPIISYTFCLFSICCLSLLPEDGVCQRQTFLLRTSLALQTLGRLPRQNPSYVIWFFSQTCGLWWRAVSQAVWRAGWRRIKRACEAGGIFHMFVAYLKEWYFKADHTWKWSHLLLPCQVLNKNRSLKWRYGGCHTRFHRHERSLLRWVLWF